MANKRHITDRPASAESRRYKGHWEIDTVFGQGSKHCIVTLLERKSGFILLGKLPDKSTCSLNKRVIKLIRRHPGQFKTITADNGTEFHQYAAIEEECGVSFYFATPYYSWERGSNKNVNGLICQYLPKNQNMAGLTQARCETIAKKLNQRPRKRHNYKTPEEIFYA